MTFLPSEAIDSGGLSTFIPGQSIRMQIDYSIYGRITAADPIEDCDLNWAGREFDLCVRLPVNSHRSRRDCGSDRVITTMCSLLQSTL
jgi:hypothetical protein